MTDFADRKPKQDRCAIAIMAKAPKSGRVKTRLSPLLTPDEARDLGCCFLQDMTANLALAAREVAIDPYIAFAPAGSEAAFMSIVGPGVGFVLADGSHPAPEQVDGFGRCLFQAAQSLFAAGYGAVGLLNSDSPTLPTSVLVEAARSVTRQHDCMVLGPSTDGGYYLIAMNRPPGQVFSAIDWSTDRVAAQTRARAHERGLDLVDLETWYDIDDPASLHRLIGELDGTGRRMSSRHIPYAAPFTAGWMRHNGMFDRFQADMRGEAMSATDTTR